MVLTVVDLSDRMSPLASGSYIFSDACYSGLRIIHDLLLQVIRSQWTNMRVGMDGTRSERGDYILIWCTESYGRGHDPISIRNDADEFPINLTNRNILGRTTQRSIFKYQTLVHSQVLPINYQPSPLSSRLCIFIYSCTPSNWLSSFPLPGFSRLTNSTFYISLTENLCRHPGAYVTLEDQVWMKSASRHGLVGISEPAAGAARWFYYFLSFHIKR